MAKPRCLFSFYGGKSKIIGRYPKPTEDQIVEPFAGGAAYSLRYHERRVHLNELNPVVYDVWDYLLGTPVEDVLAAVPRAVEKGDRVSEILPDDAHPGLVGLMRANANMGTMGATGVHDAVTWFAVTHWHQVHRRLEYWLPHIQHWTISPLDYRDFPNFRATWFIDPPYNNPAGQRYLHSDIDYAHLAKWCREREGQVVVCENVGADWLPFDTVIGDPNVRGGVRKVTEVAWVR